MYTLIIRFAKDCFERMKRAKECVKVAFKMVLQIQFVLFVNPGQVRNAKI